MIPGVNDPGPWQWYVKRPDNRGLSIMEVKRKYMHEQLLFEQYISTLNTLSTVSTAAAGAAGGPAPGGGGPDTTPAKEILTESGDAILAENGDFLVTE